MTPFDALPDLSMEEPKEPVMAAKRPPFAMVGPPHCCPTCGADTKRKDTTCANSLCRAFVPRGAGVFTS